MRERPRWSRAALWGRVNPARPKCGRHLYRERERDVYTHIIIIIIVIIMWSSSAECAPSDLLLAKVRKWRRDRARRSPPQLPTSRKISNFNIVLSMCIIMISCSSSSSSLNPKP